jgi:beta-glucanase (GH16 family)
MNFTRRRVLAALTASTALLQVSRQALAQALHEGKHLQAFNSLRSPEDGNPNPGTFPVLAIHDVQKIRGQSRVMVPVRRLNASLYTCTIQVKLGWPENYPDPRKWGKHSKEIIVPWNADEVLVPFDLPQDFDDTSKVRAVLQTKRVYAENQIEIAKADAYITSATVTRLPPVEQSIVHGDYPIHRPPESYREAFFSNLVDGFEATDSGLTKDGKPCWKSQLGHGRTQKNGELGIATDPSLHASYGAMPWIIENGKRVLQAQKLEVPISYKGKEWYYSGPMLTTETLFHAGYGWIEARIAFDGVQGTWPAFWMKCSPHWIWPPEEDILEWAFPKADAAQNLPFFTQWWRGDGSSKYAGAHVNLWEIIPGFDPTEMHSYALHWTDKLQEWFVDGILVHSQPNRNLIGSIHDAANQKGKMYLKLNIAVGGQGGTPDDAKFPSKMTVDHVRAWQVA